MIRISLGLLCILGLATHASSRIVGEVKRETPYQGVTLVDVVRKTPRPLRIHAVFVDLRAEGLSVRVGTGRRLKRGEVGTKRVRLMAKEQGFAVAVNGGPYRPAAVAENTPVKLAGPVRSGGRTLVASRDTRAALCILSGNRAAIRNAPLRGRGIVEALAGFDSPRCLVAGRPKGPNSKPEPRTAVGVSRDGRSLILVVVDGRQKGRSEGLTIHELAKLLRELGAHDGLNLDGGGGSTLVVADEDGLHRVRNRPVGLAIPGTERAVGSCLGIIAKRRSPEPETPAKDPEPETPEEPPLPEIPELPENPSLPPPGDDTIGPPVAPEPEPDAKPEPRPDPPAPAPSEPAATGPRRGATTWIVLGAALAVLALLVVLGRRRGDE